MTIENFQAHHVPFSFESDHEVQDFVIPSQEDLQNEVEQLVSKAWDNQDDVTGYIDYNVNQVRNLTALADAAEAKAKFAQRTAKGFRANVEYRRTLIEAALNAAVSRGLMKQPKVKSAEYSLGIQGTAGRIEVDPDLDLWREELNETLTKAVNILVCQILEGSPIELSDAMTEELAHISTAYLENAGSAFMKDMDVLIAKTSLTWDKKYLGQALKNNWLSEKLARLFTVVKGKALVIRL
jgi:hypothetical protein